MTLVKLFLFTIEDAIDEESILEQEQFTLMIEKIFNPFDTNLVSSPHVFTHYNI